jgi:hypothetical protein
MRERERREERRTGRNAGTSLSDEDVDSVECLEHEPNSTAGPHGATATWEMAGGARK